MPTFYELDRDKGIVRSWATGDLTEEESRSHYTKLAADPQFDSSFHQICDLTEVTDLEASSKFLQELAMKSVFSEGSRRAFVAPADLHFGLARMLQVFCDIEGSEVGVFRTVAEAEAWLRSPVERPSDGPQR